MAQKGLVPGGGAAGAGEWGRRGKSLFLNEVGGSSCSGGCLG